MSELEKIFAAAPSVALEPGQSIFREGDSVQSALWIETGAARLVRTNVDGARVSLLIVQGPCWFAEASVFAECYHCDAEAVTVCSVRRLSKNGFIEAITQDPGRAFAAMKILAADLRQARWRAELLAIRRVGDRLDHWLAVHRDKPRNTPWSAVAEELGVSVEALYRELSIRRAREGVSAD